MKIVVVGDTCFQNIKNSQFSIDQKILEIFNDSDIVLGNLEAPITNSINATKHKAIVLKADSSCKNILSLFNVCSLANNHIMDYGSEGLAETIDFLKLLNITSFGANLNLDRTVYPCLVEKNDYRLLFIGLSKWQNATEKKAGTAPLDIRTFKRIISKQNLKETFVIVYAHWNYEFVDYPCPDDRKFAHKLIDLGADLIIGSHPHILHGYEKYKDKYIFYSLGNFIFNNNLLVSKFQNDIRTNFSSILEIDLLKNKKIKFNIIPVETNANSVCLLEGDKKLNQLRRIEKLSAILGSHFKYRKNFYIQASYMMKEFSAEFKNMISKKGWNYLLLRIFKVKKQDIKIKILSTLLSKNYVYTSYNNSIDKSFSNQK